MAKKLQAWVGEPFFRVIESLEESSEFAEAVSFGIANTGRLALAEEIVQKLDEVINLNAPSEDADSKSRLKDLQQRTERAERQMQKGLPLLHAQLSVGTWSALEAAMDDFVIAWLCHVPEALRSDEFAKIRIPIGDFEECDREARMHFVLGEYKRNLRSDSKLGIDRF